MLKGFTRKEVMNLTGVTSGKLSYWDKTKLVSPSKAGNPKKPLVIYEWKHIIQLQLIMRLQEKLSLQEIRKVLNFLEEKDYNQSLFECRLFFVDAELYLVESLEDFGDFLIKASGKNKGQLILRELEPFKNILADLKQEAITHHIPDFEERIKGTTLELVLA